MILQKPSENSVNYFDFARSILAGDELNDKLFFEDIDWSHWKAYELPARPGRKGKLCFSDQQMKFPKSSRLSEPEKKAMALHSFANHELLAIEMMAAALLVYPHNSQDEIRFKKGILTALKDEQKHLKLYIQRIEELGFSFGDFPLNDFFWKQMEKLKTPSQYTAVMALTFESANLDFARYYADLFRGHGDEKTAQILETVLEDELTHVGFGAHWMKKWRQDKSLWDYYLSSLPWPLTPARSKGIDFKFSLHAKAIMDEDFIKELVTYDDAFKITKRS